MSKGTPYMTAPAYVLQCSSRGALSLVGGAITPKDGPSVRNSWSGQIDV